ncbi:hypothetical protein GmHk_04G011107 [Glycine max]|nr:hypothetical protein GmHk_04G011107 [Glycine max]
MADAELSPAGVDRLKATLAKLTLSQLNLTAVVDTIATTIDDLLQRLSLHNLTPHFSSSIPAQAPIPVAIISTPLMSTPLPMQQRQSPMPTLSPMPLLSSMPPPPSMSTVPMLHTHATKSRTITSSASHADCASMSCTRATIPSTIVGFASYACSSSAQSRPRSHYHFLQQAYQHLVPHDKPWKNKDMTLFEMGHPHTSSNQLPLHYAKLLNQVQFAGIDLEIPPQHLEDKVFLMGQGMLGCDKEPKAAAENIFTKPETRV